MSISALIELNEPDLPWRHIWTGSHQARGQRFELQVSRELLGGQLRIFVFKDDEFLSYISDPKHEVECGLGSDIESRNVDDLILAAISDIDENLQSLY